MPKVICSKQINKYYNNPIAGYFGIEKIWKLIAKKYYQPTPKRDIKAYIKGYNIYLTSKAVDYKLYRNLKSLPMLTHY